MMTLSRIRGSINCEEEEKGKEEEEFYHSCLSRYQPARASDQVVT